MFDFLFDFFGRACFATIGLAIPAGIIGCFLLWRRLAFLGDAMGHAAVLGVGLGVFLASNVSFFVVLICLIMALLLGRIHNRQNLPIDTILTVISYSSLALGLILLSKSMDRSIEPDHILFGDILALGYDDLVLIYSVALTAVFLFALCWRSFLLMTLDEDLAHVSGVPVTKYRFIFILIVALVVAIGLKMAGALLLPALMIIPAFTASLFAKTPEKMVMYSVTFSILGNIIGLESAFWFDFPPGPAIILGVLILLSIGGGVRFLQSK